MNRIDQLPEITEHVLSGLQADDSLKHKIHLKAAGISAGTEEKKTSRLPVAALCAISAALIAVFVLLFPLSRNGVTGNQPTVSGGYESIGINSIPAGTVLPESPVSNNHEEESAPGECDELSPEEEEPEKEAEAEEPGSGSDSDME